MKAPLVQSTVGLNPTGSEKNGNKRYVLLYGAGNSFSLVLTSPGCHDDVTQLEDVLNDVVVKRPEIGYRKGFKENLCVGKRYFGESAFEIIVMHGYITRIVSRGGEQSGV